MHETEPGDPKILLSTAKDRFRERVLENDALFSIIKEKLFPQEHEADLPDFTCEPTYQPKDDQTVDIGIRLGTGITESEAGITLTFFKLAYINLGTIQPDRRSVIPKLESKYSQDEIEELLHLWQQGWSDIEQSVGRQNLGIDPMTHTIELMSELERTAYPDE
jgi:hypothetical protein